MVWFMYGMFTFLLVVVVISIIILLKVKKSSGGMQNFEMFQISGMNLTVMTAFSVTYDIRKIQKVTLTIRKAHRSNIHYIGIMRVVGYDGKKSRPYFFDSSVYKKKSVLYNSKEDIKEAAHYLMKRLKAHHVPCSVQEQPILFYKKEREIMKTKIICIIASVLLAFFLIRTYWIGYKVDFLDWTTEIEVFSRINMAGIIMSLSVIVLYFINKKRNNKGIKVVGNIAFVLAIILFVSSFVLVPKWEEIRKEQVAEGQVFSEKRELQKIEWKDIEDIKKEQDYHILYVGRDNCNDCKKIHAYAL